MVAVLGNSYVWDVTSADVDDAKLEVLDDGRIIVSTSGNSGSNGRTEVRLLSPDNTAVSLVTKMSNVSGSAAIGHDLIDIGNGRFALLWQSQTQSISDAFGIGFQDTNGYSVGVFDLNGTAISQPYYSTQFSSRDLDDSLVDIVSGGFAVSEHRTITVIRDGRGLVGVAGEDADTVVFFNDDGVRQSTFSLPESQDFGPHLTALSNGNVNITYSDDQRPGQIASDFRTDALTVSKTGSAISSAIRIGRDDQNAPSTTVALADGKVGIFVNITFANDFELAVLNSDGSLAFGPLVFDNSKFSTAPEMAQLVNGHYAVVVKQADKEFIDVSVVSPDGSFAKPRTTLQPSGDDNWDDPKIVALSNGGFLVAAIRDGVSDQLQIQQFDGAGNQVGTPLSQALNTASAVLEGLEALPDGNAVMIWRDTGSGSATIQRIAVEGPKLTLTDVEAQQVAYLYEASLGRQADAGGLNFWIDQREAGQSLQNLASSFLGSDEFAASVGGSPSALSSVDFVNKLYQNVLGRPGETDGIQFWSGRLDAGTSREDVLIGFAVSPENATGSAYIQGLAETAPGTWAFV